MLRFITIATIALACCHAITIVPRSMDPVLRDNELVFEAEHSTNAVKSITFEEKSHVISDGEPWEGVACEQNKMHVKAGRHTSAQPAQFFSQGLQVTQTTATMHDVDSAPKELNFAIVGKLHVTFADGSDFVLDDFHVGQGSYLTKFDWWVGQAGCSSVPKSHNVECATSGGSIKKVKIQGEDKRPNVFNLAALETEEKLAVAAAAAAKRLSRKVADPVLRDNELVFESEDTTTAIALVEFALRDYSVSIGQPFEGVKTDGNRLHVLAGRHASKEPAVFFNDGLMVTSMTATQHDVDSQPDELNFAVSGTLKVHFADGRAFEFPNFHIAQGHYKNDNNWWIGDASCTSLPQSHKVDCTATGGHVVHMQGEDARPNVFNLLPL